MKILIVDDDPVIIRSCSRILESEGHEIQSADTVEHGEALLTESTFDLMITDIKMPGHDGFEMIRRSVRIQAALSILVMTGYLMPEIVDEMRQLGVNQFIPKPFTPDELLSAVADAYKGTP